MIPDEAGWPEGGHVLGPGASFIMTADIEHIGAEMMRALMANPTAITFEVGSYALFQLDDAGVEETVNFAKLGESVIQRTGLVVVDDGRGRIRKHMIATNVLRHADGSGAGIPLEEALRDVLGLDFETTMSVDAGGAPVARVLSRLGEVASYDPCDARSPDHDPDVDCSEVRPRGFWMIGGTGPEFDGGQTADFDRVVLRSGQRVNLVYNEDTDGDGLFDREELLLGTDAEDPDTDADGLTDYEETKVGWTVAIQGRDPHPIYPDPRFADVDGDLLSDSTERESGTDPYRRDTDEDGDEDNFDYDPLNPPCIDGGSLAMVAWWDGTVDGVTASDVWGADGQAQRGLLQSPSMSDGSLGDQAFKFNPDFQQSDQWIDVEPDPGLDAVREYALSVDVYWSGRVGEAGWSTLIAKGPPEHENYGLYLDEGGHLMLRHRRVLKDKCWGSFFGWVDDLCRDTTREDAPSLITSGSIPARQWVHVVAGFSGDTMRIHVDGVEVASKTTSGGWENGTKHRIWTLSLVTNQDPLRIGADLSEPVALPYVGWLDDIQFFARDLRSEQVSPLYGLGVCVP